LISYPFLQAREIARFDTLPTLEIKGTQTDVDIDIVRMNELIISLTKEKESHQANAEQLSAEVKEIRGDLDRVQASLKSVLLFYHHYSANLTNLILSPGGIFCKR
jgi:hypothetical protein